MYKAALLDFDGTICDTILDIHNAIVHVFNKNGLNVPDLETSRELLGDGLKLLLHKALNATGNDLSQADSITEQFIEHYATICTETTTLYNDILDVVDTLLANDIKVAIVSNKSEKFLHIILNHFNIADKFEVIVGGDTYAEKKPSAFPILKTLEILDIDKENALMVGDSKNDLLAGVNADVDTCICNYGYLSGLANLQTSCCGTDKAIKANFYIDNALQLLDIFKIDSKVK